MQSVLTQAHPTMSYMARTHSPFIAWRCWEPCYSLSGNNNVGWGSLTCTVHVDTLTDIQNQMLNHWLCVHGSRYWCVDLLLVHITSCDHKQYSLFYQEEHSWHELLLIGAHSLYWHHHSHKHYGVPYSVSRAQHNVSSIRQWLLQSPSTIASYPGSWSKRAWWPLF